MLAFLGQGCVALKCWLLHLSFKCWLVCFAWCFAELVHTDATLSSVGFSFSHCPLCLIRLHPLGLVCQVEGGLRFHESLTKQQLAPWPSLKPLSTPHAEPARSSPNPEEGEEGCEELLTLTAEEPSSKTRLSPPMFKMPSSTYDADSPPPLPPLANRMSNRIPPKIDGGVRKAKVPAPNVSQQPAAA